MKKFLLAASVFALAGAAQAQTSILGKQVTVSGVRLDRLVTPLFSVVQYGAADDNLQSSAAANTAAIQQAINDAAAQKRTLNFPCLNTCIYRVNTLNFSTINVHFEEGVQLRNADGSAYSGFYPGILPLAQTMSPGALAIGGRVDSPGVDTLALNTLTSNAGYARQAITLYQGQSTGGANPFTTNGAIRGVGLLGQNGPSSGSFGVLVGQINNYANTNGPGITVTGTLTNGSAVITNVNTTGMFDPAQVTSTTAGVPTNAWIVDGGIGASTLTMNAPFTGTTTSNAAITVVSGFSELTPIAIGSFDVDGPVNRKTVARYYDFNISTNVSSDANDQERYLSGGTHFVVKNVPGNVSDKIRRGSNGDAVVTRPGGEGFNYQNRSTVTTYPLSFGRLTWGYSGNPATVTSGDQAAATPGFIVGNQVGGLGGTVWDRESQRSFMLIGEQIEDYEQFAIHIRYPHTQRGLFSGVAIGVDPLGGDIRSGDHFASNGVTPTLAGTGGTGYTQATGCTDTHCTVSVPTSSTAFTITFAKPYASAPDVVVSSPSGYAFTYAVTSTTLTVNYSAAPSAKSFTFISMGK